jgi:purine-nucleoside phosphorylase
MYPTAGMSLITNVVILEHDSDKVPPSHQEVIETGQMRALDMHRLVKGVIEKLAEATAEQSHHTNNKD